MGQAPCCCGDPRSGGNEVKVERTAVSTATAPRPPSPDAREETLSTNHLQPGPPITDDAVSDRDVAAMAQQPAAPSPRGRGGGDSTLGMLTQISLAPTGTQVSNTHSHKEQMKEIIRLFWREAMKGINVNIVSLEPNSLSVVPAEFRLSGDKSSFTVTETGEQGGQEGRSLEWPFGQTDYVAKNLETVQRIIPELHDTYAERSVLVCRRDGTKVVFVCANKEEATKFGSMLNISWKVIAHSKKGQ
uniref:Uncharacterized protein n=1 Tax=Chromera velia CCMP2878 TaxID=1169474 RepID=A0A0G4GFF3_9ALVE|mmetsp:Transcript_9946/g.19293  ORF Transcript_9946/g.19293 Transcript_9946/m.19293 type:complete len:245 (+) Transcript_9946:268-1002(+)|eukprot:Cvel_4632.t1-p1 / transcript=Cvel_4632.t1 / gene=Cvel_4632 / organism=Chromera_velia_CCMP2878 / gene_product=hypothetical protein / transcript_product=hypothetical protein / location=Cvel_scaffold204:46183-46914(-) / protein_length=244 / sequence_SO=supercontig / SO=protein_coding / is_pseudo=false